MRDEYCPGGGYVKRRIQRLSGTMLLLFTASCLSNHCFDGWYDGSLLICFL